MRKSVSIIAAFLFAALPAGAQTVQNAVDFSSVNYYGTARTVAMGNAVTAVGSDLGSVPVNPAGSAVAAYSQFEVTPALTFAVCGTSYAPSYVAYDNPGQESGSLQYGPAEKLRTSKFTVPNLGINLRFATGADFGLRSINFGVVSSIQNFYYDNWSGGGITDYTSLSGALATQATGRMDPKILSNADPWRTGVNWNWILGYRGGLISYMPEMDAYFGAAEKVTANAQGGYDVAMEGSLLQRLSQATAGSKNDIVLNFAMDFNENLYIGVNVGIPVLRYSSTWAYTERIASDESDFHNVPQYYGSDGVFHKAPSEQFFEGLGYSDVQNFSMSGVYAKLGVIWLPTENLRFGAAVQTPTAYNVTHSWQSFANADYSKGSIWSSKDHTPDDAGSTYNFRSSWSFNLGLALTFAGKGLVSADYELADYSHTAFSYSGKDAVYNSDFERVNKLNGLFCGVSHNLRIGLELKPLPFLALRAGYGLMTDPMAHYKDPFGKDVDVAIYDSFYNEFESGEYKITGNRKYDIRKSSHSFSLGLGYLSAGSFYADFAARLNCKPVTYAMPYADYLSWDDGMVYSPIVSVNRRLWDVMLTLGWRF